MLMRALLFLWLLLWVRIAFPWQDFQTTPSFRRVELLPFTVGSTRGQLLNVLAFVPLGIIAVRMGWRPRMVVTLGLGLSVLTELLQLFSRRRFPSTTDVLLNSVGVVIGVAIATGWSRWSARKTPK
jgi:glycopeptide antibiotics resistance protein